MSSTDAFDDSAIVDILENMSPEEKEAAIATIDLKLISQLKKILPTYVSKVATLVCTFCEGGDQETLDKLLMDARRSLHNIRNIYSKDTNIILAFESLINPFDIDFIAWSLWDYFLQLHNVGYIRDPTQPLAWNNDMLPQIEEARVERYRTKILQRRATRGRAGFANAVDATVGGSIETGEDIESREIGEQVEEMDEQGHSDSDHLDIPGSVEATEGMYIRPTELKGAAEITVTEMLEEENAVEDHRSQTLGSDHGTNVEGLQGIQSKRVLNGLNSDPYGEGSGGCDVPGTSPTPTQSKKRRRNVNVDEEEEEARPSTKAKRGPTSAPYINSDDEATNVPPGTKSTGKILQPKSKKAGRGKKDARKQVGPKQAGADGSGTQKAAPEEDSELAKETAETEEDLEKQTAYSVSFNVTEWDSKATCSECVEKGIPCILQYFIKGDPLCGLKLGKKERRQRVFAVAACNGCRIAKIKCRFGVKSLSPCPRFRSRYTVCHSKHTELCNFEPMAPDEKEQLRTIREAKEIADKALRNAETGEEELSQEEVVVWKKPAAKSKADAKWQAVSKPAKADTKTKGKAKEVDDGASKASGSGQRVTRRNAQQEVNVQKPTPAKAKLAAGKKPRPVPTELAIEENKLILPPAEPVIEKNEPLLVPAEPVIEENNPLLVPTEPAIEVDVDRPDPQVEREALEERVTYLEATVSAIRADAMISGDVVKRLQDDFTERWRKVDADFKAIKKGVPLAIEEVFAKKMDGIEESVQRMVDERVRDAVKAIEDKFASMDITWNKATAPNVTLADIQQRLKDLETRNSSSLHSEGHLPELNEPMQYVKTQLEELRMRMDLFTPLSALSAALEKVKALDDAFAEKRKDDSTFRDSMLQFVTQYSTLFAGAIYGVGTGAAPFKQGPMGRFLNSEGSPNQDTSWGYNPSLMSRYYNTRKDDNQRQEDLVPPNMSMSHAGPSMSHVRQSSSGHAFNSLPPSSMMLGDFPTNYGLPLTPDQGQERDMPSYLHHHQEQAKEYGA